jgi:hypothetical protein
MMSERDLGEVLRQERHQDAQRLWRWVFEQAYQRFGRSVDAAADDASAAATAWLSWAKENHAKGFQK